jgi:hypothetical protein
MDFLSSAGLVLGWRRDIAARIIFFAFSALVESVPPARQIAGLISTTNLNLRFLVSGNENYPHLAISAGTDYLRALCCRVVIDISPP